MKKLFLALLFVSCATSFVPSTTTTIYNKNFSKLLVDSIIKAEGIGSIDSLGLRSDKGIIKEYYFHNDSLIIRFIKKGDSIQVTKRINK